MSAVDHSAAAILATKNSYDFDELGALLWALRGALEPAAAPTITEAAHLYCLAAMAEQAWSKLDSAMKVPPR